jgi:hypothetical protein
MRFSSPSASAFSSHASRSLRFARGGDLVSIVPPGVVCGSWKLSPRHGRA